MKKPIRIDSIPALKGTELSSEFKQNLQEQYNDILIYNLDKPEPPYGTKTMVADTFTEGFLYQLGDGNEPLDYIRIFAKDNDPKNGNVGFSIIPDHLDQLGMGYDDAYEIALRFIYSPILTPAIELCYSIFHSKDLFFHIHQLKLSDHLAGFSYKRRHQIDQIKVLPHGVVLMYV